MGQINGWVEDQTRGEIVDLLPSLPPGAAMVLANAVAFDGAWTEPFEMEFTQPARFLTPSGEVAAPTMRRTLDTRYGAAVGFQAVGLAYGKRKEARLWIVLPDDPTGLAAVEAALTAEGLAATFDAATEREVNIQLPRLELRTRLDLKGAMQRLGLERAWEEDAEFGATGVEGVYLSQLLHEAVAEVDEEGTRARAATIAVTTMPTVSVTPPQFVVDRPYLLVIRDEVTGTFLFVGRVSDPLASG